MNIDDVIVKISPEKDYKVTEISRMTGLSYSCILANIKRGSFPSRLIFNRLYVKGRDLKKYLTGE